MNDTTDSLRGARVMVDMRGKGMVPARVVGTSTHGKRSRVTVRFGRGSKAVTVAGARVHPMPGDVVYLP